MYMSKGNKKVNACIFNLPAGTTCKPGLQCQKYCYAKKAQRMYPNVLPCRTLNYNESKHDDFILKAVNEIEKSKKDVVRIHESGDFYSSDYLEKWYIICELLPYIKFYAYSKQYEIIDSIDYKPDNLTLIKSFDEINISNEDAYCKWPFSKTAIVSDNKTNCKAQVKDNIKCMTDCFKCIDNKCTKIIFKKH